MSEKKIFVDHAYQTSAYLVNPKVHTVSDISAHAGVEGQLAAAGGNLYFHDGSNWFALIESNYSGALTGVPNFNPTTGTVPFTVESGKVGKVDNLNADLLDGYDTSTTAVASKIPVYGTSGVLKVGTPSADEDAANKLYVDNAIQGLDIKASVKAATTPAIGAITLSGEKNIDGISLVTGDRILVKDQTTASQNGIYIVDTSAWSLADDSDSDSLSEGAYVFVEGGTVNNNTGWTYTDASAYTWSQFSGAGQLTAGDGLVKVGDAISVSVAAPISIVSDAVTIQDAAITGAKLANNTVTSAQLADDIQVSHLGVGVASSSSYLIIAKGDSGDSKPATIRLEANLPQSADSSNPAVLDLTARSKDDASPNANQYYNNAAIKALGLNGAGAKLQFWTDQTTGADTLGMVLDESQQLGIGNFTSTAVGAKLHVKDASTVLAQIEKTTTGSAYISIGNSTTGVWDGSSANTGILFGIDSNDHAMVWNRGAKNVRIGTNNTERITVESDGDVKVHERLGIGSTPDKALTAVSGTVNTSIARFTGANLDRGLVISTSANGTTNDASIEYDAVSANALGRHIFKSDGSTRMQLSESGTLYLLDSNGGVGTNSLELSYSGTNGVATFKPHSSSGNTEISLSTTSSGTAAEALRINSAGDLDVKVGNLQVDKSKGIGRTYHASLVGGGYLNHNYAGNHSSSAGYLAITLPVDFNSTMLSFKIDTYEYNSNTRGVTFAAGGYLVNSGNGAGYWQSHYFNIDSSNSENNEQYKAHFNANSDGKCVVYIEKYGTNSSGEEGWLGAESTWAYIKVSIRDVLFAHSGGSYNSWIDGWSVSLESTLPNNATIARTYAVYPKPYSTGSANYIPKFGANNIALEDSVIYESSGNIAIGHTTPTELLHVTGGQILSSDNSNSNGPNFRVNTTNKDAAEYAYKVERSGSAVGGILIGGWVAANDGTVGGPGFRFTNDPDTGIYPPADNTLGFSTGGAEYMRLDSAGTLSTTNVSGISTKPGNIAIFADTPEATASIASGSANSYLTLKFFQASRSGGLRFKFYTYIESGTYHFAYRIYNVTTSTSLLTGSSSSNLDPTNTASVHNYRKFNFDVTSGWKPGDLIALQMTYANSAGTPTTGTSTGQTFYVKEFQLFSTTNEFMPGAATQMVFGKYVGIGTASPGYELDVAGSAAFGSAATRLLTYSDASYSGIYNGSSLYSDEAIYFGTDKIYFIAGGAEGMRLTSTGLGVNVTNPYGRFEVALNPTTSSTTVNETADFTDKFVISNASSSPTLGDRIPLVFNFGGDGQDHISAAIVGERATTENTWNTELSFWVNGVTSGAQGTDAIQEGMRLTSTGLGIGNTSPGSFYSEADNLVVGPLSGDNGITICSGAAGKGSIFFADDTDGAGSYQGQIRYNHNGNFMQFCANAFERMRLTPTGLSIGFTGGEAHPKLDLIPGTTSGDPMIRFRNSADSGTVANIKAMQTNGTIDRISIGTAESEHLSIASDGAVTASNGGTNLKQVARVHSGTITGDATTTSFTVTHNLETENIVVSVRDISARTLVECEVVLNASATDTAVDIRFNSAPANNKTYQVTVVG